MYFFFDWSASAAPVYYIVVPICFAIVFFILFGIDRLLIFVAEKCVVAEKCGCKSIEDDDDNKDIELKDKNALDV